MACYHPLEAWRSRASGSIQFVERGDAERLTLPCGKCIGCRRKQGIAWAMRCVHESRMHQHNAFVTLTYDDEHYKPGLEYTDVQLWLKKLRKRKGPLRFFAAGEYGDITERPHWHVLLFGCELSDARKWNKSLWRSPDLDKTWEHGQALFGAITPASASYCAKYTMKRKSGAMADGYYTRLDQRTGDLVKVAPEMARMSLKPALGKSWIRRNWPDVYRVHDAVLHDGKLHSPPTFYDDELKKLDPDLWEEIALKRFASAEKYESERTPERLGARELVALAMSKRKETLL